jgi:hypothetical protein
VRIERPRYRLIAALCAVAAAWVLVGAAAASVEGLFAGSLPASPSVALVRSPGDGSIATREGTGHAAAAAESDRSWSMGPSLLDRYRNLVGDFRFQPGSREPSWGFLLSKTVLLGALIFGVIVLPRRCELWWTMLCAASALLAFNILLDVGGVALTYNEPGWFGRSSVAPLFACFEPSFAWPVIGHVALIGSLLLFALPRLLSPACGPIVFGIVVFVAAVLGPASLGLSSPPRQVLHQFFFSGLDYIQYAGSLWDTPRMLRGYVASMPYLSVHASVHGPGPILTLSLFRSVAGNSVFLLTTMLQVVAALLPVLTWLTARRFMEDGAARLAAWLLILTPSFHQFSFLSMEGVIALPLFGTAALLVFCLFGRRSTIGSTLLLGAMAYVSFSYSFSSAYLAPFGLFAAVLAVHWGLASRARAGKTVLYASGAFVAAYLLMRGAGFDLLACFWQAKEINAAMMGSAWRSPSHYFFSSSGTLGAFAIGCGIPVTALWWIALRRCRGERSIASCVISSASATVLLLALLGLYQWEVERIWLFLVPWVCISAARPLHDIGRNAPRRAVAVLTVLWLQTLASELLLDTYW